MPLLKIGRGTVHAQNNQQNYDAPLATFYGSGRVDSNLDNNLPAAHSYTGFQGGTGEPEPEPKPGSDPENCLRIDRDKKIEIDLNVHNCVDISENLSGRLLQVWDSNINKSCNFRGELVATNTGAQWSIDSNYAGTRSLSGSRVRIRPSNGCGYLMVRWL